MREKGVRAHGDELARRFWLKEHKSHVTRTLRRGVLAVTQLKSDLPTPAPTQSIGYDDAYLVALQLRAVPDHELWQDGRPVQVEAFAAMDTSFYDLRRDPIALVRQPYHCLQFYLPRAVLAEIAQQNDCRFKGELDCRYGIAKPDPVIRHLGAALIPALERGETVDGLFLDHVLEAMGLHIVSTYGSARPAERVTGGLAPWQEHRAKELMRDNLAADSSLGELARVCGLSVAHFTRAFRQTTGTSPHRWLRERRLEQAMILLARTDEALAAIAAACGFVDQSHFTRAFTRRLGVSPGQWRRQQRATKLHS
jgi:AraC family transcriptional regulator